MAKLFRVQLEFSVGTVAAENVTYFESTLNAEDLTANIDAGFAEQIRKCQYPGVSWGTITATQVGHLLLDPDFFSRTVSHVGERAGAASDPQLAACIRLHTGLSGRKRRGRLFLAGVPDDGVTNGKLEAGEQGNINTRFGQIITDYVTGSPATKWVVFSRSIFGGLTDIILDSYKPVTAFNVNPVMSTMRSRKPV